MRYKIYRRSAPHMEPLVSDEYPMTLSEAQERLSATWSTRSSQTTINGVPTFIANDDISYIQIVDDDEN